MYKIGDIFEYDNDYINKVEFCNNNNLVIVELQSDGGARKFQIQEPPLPTQEELNKQRKWEIQERLNQLSQDFVQAMAGAYFEDLEERKAEFQTLHNELRVLEGKEPREYTKEENSIE